MKKKIKKDFKMINTSVFGKTMGNIRKQRYQAYNNQSKKEYFGMI